MARFIHTSDWHIGKSLHNFDLIQDQKEALDQLIQILEDERPDALLVAGDIYDRSVPAADAVQLLDDVLIKIVDDLKVPVVMIAGNHDSGERLGFGARFLQTHGLHLIGQVGPVRPIVIAGVEVVGLPYTLPLELRSFLGSEALNDTTAMQRHLAMAHAACQGPRRVLVGHAFVEGGLESTSERSLSLGTAGRVPAEVFDGFSYVALGHLHRPQDISGPSRIRYSGSLFTYSESELDQQKSVTLVEIGEDGNTQTRLIPFSPSRTVQVWEGRFADLFATPSIDNYLYLKLTDPSPIPDAMSTLRKVHPHLLELKWNCLDQGPRSLPAARDVRRLSPEALLQDFFAETLEQTPTPREFELLLQAMSN